MTTALTFLESFDSSQPDQENHPEFTRGFTAGHAEALRELAVEQDNHLSEIQNAIREIEFGFAEARLSILRDLEGLFDAILITLLPQLSELAIVQQVSETLSQLMQEQTHASPVLAMHPEQANAIGERLQSAAGGDLKIQSDPSLPLNSVWITTPQTTSIVDLSVVLEAVHTAIGVIQTNALSHSSKEATK